MFWRALWFELRIRLRRPILAVAALVGLVLTVFLIAALVNRSLPPEAIPLRFVLVPLLITVTWSACAWQWIRAARAAPAKNICQSCGYSLVGHQRKETEEGALTRCSECGADPMVLTWKHAAAWRIVQAIGCIMLIWALLCCLLAFGSLALWGSID